MPFLDELKQFITSRVLPAVGQVGQQLGAYSVGGSQGLQNLAASQQQKAQFAEEERQRNSLSAYQTAALKQQSDAMDASAGQQHFENLFKIARGRSEGSLLDAQPGEPGAFTESGVYEGEPDITVKPALLPKAHTMTIGKDSPLGSAIGLDQDMEGIPQEDYLKLATQYAEKLAGREGKSKSLEALQAMQGDIGDTINQRFSPNHYESVYGKGNIDPEMALHRTNFQNRLKSAMLEDQARGNSTRLQGLQKDIDSFQSPWEKEFQKKQDRDYSSNLAFRQHMDTYDMEHPAPTPESVQAGLRSYKEYGLKALTGLKSLNPRLALAVESEGAKQGLNPIALTNDEVQNRGLSKIALRRLNEAENVLSQPGMDKVIGPAISRFKTFMSGSVGSGMDQRVKQVQDALQFGMGAVGKIHYTARGSANQNIQEQLHKVIGADRMDYPTLMQGIRDTKAILNDYALEGDVGDSSPNPVAGALGLPAPSAGGLVAPRKGGR